MSQWRKWAPRKGPESAWKGPKLPAALNGLRVFVCFGAFLEKSGSLSLEFGPNFGLLGRTAQCCALYSVQCAV